MMQIPVRTLTLLLDSSAATIARSTHSIIMVLRLLQLAPEVEARQLRSPAQLWMPKQLAQLALHDHSSADRGGKEGMAAGAV